MNKPPQVQGTGMSLQKDEKKTSMYYSYLPTEALAMVAKLVEMEEEEAEAADWLLQ